MAKNKGKNKGKGGKGKGKGKGGKGGNRFRGSTQVPPLGTFDPAYESRRFASRRGLRDLIADTTRGEGRSREDLVTELANLLRGNTRGLEDFQRAEDRGYRDIGRTEERGLEDFGVRHEDITRAQARGLADLLSAETRAGEDFDYAGRKLDRDYRFLGNRQAQQANVTGQFKGGAIQAAAAKRQANQAFEFEPIQTKFGRTVADIGTNRGRLNEDTDLGLAELARQQNRFTQDIGTQRDDLGADLTTGRNRLGQDYSANVNISNRGFGRGQEDRVTNLSRGTREQALLEQDITAQEYFDASQRDPKLEFPSYRYQSGGRPPKKPNKPRNRRNRNRGR